jgi:hypothetical protein
MSIKEIKDKIIHCQKTMESYGKNADIYLERFIDEKDIYKKAVIKKDIKDVELFDLFMNNKLQGYEVIDIKSYLKMYKDINDEMVEKVEELKKSLYEKLKLNIV